MKTRIKNLARHSTHRESAIRFALLAAVMLGYFIYLSVRFDIASGGMLALLTWSFFVLCTPVADAGFLVDFPLRVLLNIRMVKSEIVVWAIAIAINVYALSYAGAAYEKTFITGLFKHIILTPYPYWGIILLSGVGSFLSIYFGDELMDVVRHSECAKYHRHGLNYRIVAVVVVFLLALVAYYYLMESLGIDLNGAT